MRGIIKDGKHSYRDFGVTLKSREIGVPSKNKIKKSVPYQNGDYDFSLIYGEQTYENRTLTYKFNLIEKDKTRLNLLKMNLIEWLSNGGKQKIYDDCIPGYYFWAECISINFDEKERDGELTAEFEAYPFKICDKFENDIWDELNFELDCSQPLSFTVNGTNEIKIFNIGDAAITPEVICSANMQVTLRNKIFLFNKGSTSDWRFEFKKGENKLTVMGEGTIEFKFRKEVL